MNKQPLFILAICFILGIFFQDYFVLDENYIYDVIVLCFCVLIFTFLKSFFFYKIRPYLLGLMFFGVGVVLHFYNTFSSQNTLISQNETIVFKLSKKLNSNEKNRKYEIISQLRKETFDAVLYVSKNEKELDFKHYYKAKVYITKPKSPEYDFQFDYAKYLKRKGIEYQCYLSGELYSAKRDDLNLNEKFSQKRLDVLQNIDESTMSSKTREFLKGIILADRTEIDSQTVQDFNKSGLVHFLAISGTHIVVIFGMMYFLLMKIFPVRFRKYAIVSSLIFIWLFTVFIGFGSSVVRSSIMLSVYFIYVLLQRKPDLLHSLALSAFIILIFDTHQLFDVGFQLSFLAVLGIFWLNQPILKCFPKQDNRLKKIIFNTVSISISAQLATLPLVLYYFHQFSFISIVANFFIVPFSEIIIVFSFAVTGLMAFKVDFDFINAVYDFIIQVLLKVIHWFADFEILFFDRIPMNLTEVFSLLLIVYVLRFVILKVDIRNTTGLVISIFVFFILRIGFDWYAHQKSEVLIHNFNKTQLFSVKEGGAACFWINKNTDINRIKQFIINPYSSTKRLDKVEIKILPPLTQKIVYNGKVYEIN
ncbi:ComEC/Rec2 family competence protein [Chryseobacterium oryctis]|uniref:ComEC family competence protein n=1 Tax=Chryseobacterium oryctis TaxID=2952618 RepID=A0ABT3HKK5_9FLAO|nr:ComEC/Rec2 family competence protein [Chryseobacterium oryctis]MCW3160253.1 ComEC family competence protein [Chryseobacterium oryctis]